MSAPGKTKLIKFPPYRAGKDVKCPWYARGGGGGSLSFDLAGTLLGHAPVLHLVEGLCQFCRGLNVRLRWLKTVSSTFQDLEFDGSL